MQKLHLVLAENAGEAIQITVDRMVGCDDKPFTTARVIRALGLDDPEADGYFAVATDEVDRNDPGLLREHLAELLVEYPQARVSIRKVAQRIADLLNADKLITADQVLATAQGDAAALEEIGSL
jgi:hypothetical protein